ncbi:MAG: hypothetical protein KGY54_13590 [Oleiphilaceae bacterium]|nr:hypothetical protein [Oleiphilaceae bacterium]
MLVALVLAVAAAGAIGWYQQQQRLEAMASQLEEADYWARQSKLALARFEGDLTETGDSLDARGSSLKEQLNEQQEQIGTVNSEIRKLWVIAYEKNRPKLAEHDQLLKDYEERLTALNEKTDDHSERLGENGALLESHEESLASLSTEIDTQGGQIEDQAKNLEQQAEKDVALGQSIQANSANLDQVESSVEKRLERFEREQRLTTAGLEGRIRALENDLGQLGELRARWQQTESRLEDVENVVEAIDSARAQLTSRLVRLQEQVSAMR